MRTFLHLSTFTDQIKRQQNSRTYFEVGKKKGKKGGEQGRKGSEEKKIGAKIFFQVAKEKAHRSELFNQLLKYQLGIISFALLSHHP